MKVQTAVGLLASLAFVSCAVSQVWVRGSAPSAPWHTIASSADGTRLIAAVGQFGSGGIYTSADSGLTWGQATNAPEDKWWSVASSADGTKLAASQQFGPVYTSRDSGVTWTIADTMDYFYSASIALSADGSKMIAASSAIFLSTNSGVTWTQATNYYNPHPVYPVSFSSVASSADGTRLAAASPSEGTIYLSADSGNSWVVATNAPNQYWLSIASSADGNKLIAVYNSDSGLIYTSPDFGVTWFPATNAPATYWVTVACSADGNTLAAANEFNSTVYISTNSGASWTSTYTPLSVSDGFKSIACSADGAKWAGAVMLDSATGIYSLQPGPTLTLSLVDTNAFIMWPAYTTGDFGLQENADLTTTNWLDVATPPTPTNFQNEVVIPFAAGQVFYRLKSK